MWICTLYNFPHEINRQDAFLSIIGHQELCDYCPSEFQDEVDEENEGFKRHHRHRHHLNDRERARPVGGERRHPKGKRPTEKPNGDYEIEQSEHLNPTKSRHRQHRQRYNDDKLSFSSDEMQSTPNPESANYAEYNFDDSKMTVEDNGKTKEHYFSFFLISSYVCLFVCCFFFRLACKCSLKNKSHCFITGLSKVLVYHQTPEVEGVHAWDIPGI